MPKGTTVFLRFWVQTTLHTDFCGTEGFCFLGFASDRPPFQPVGPIFPFVPAEGTETAMLFADVGVVDVAVDDVADGVAGLGAAELVGCRTDRFDVVWISCGQEGETFCGGEILAIDCPIENALHRCLTVNNH